MLKIRRHAGTQCSDRRRVPAEFKPNAEEPDHLAHDWAVEARKDRSCWHQSQGAHSCVGYQIASAGLRDSFLRCDGPISVLLCYPDSVYRGSQNGFIASLHRKRRRVAGQTTCSPPFSMRNRTKLFSTLSIAKATLLGRFSRQLLLRQVLQ